MLKKLVKFLLKILDISINFELRFYCKHSESLKKYNTSTGVYFLPKFALLQFLQNLIFTK